jgi:hypothetical protein
MSNDNHGITNEEVGGRLKRAAWGWFLIGPLGALIGSSMKSNPTNPFTNPNHPLCNSYRTLDQQTRDRKRFIALCVLGILVLLVNAARL